MPDPDLPKHPTARLDQIHANVMAALDSFVDGVALTLLVNDPASAGHEVAGRARASDPAVIATMFAGAVVRLAQQKTPNDIPADLLASLDLTPGSEPAFEERVGAFLKGLAVLTLAHGLCIDGFPGNVNIIDPGQPWGEMAHLAWNHETASYTARDTDGLWPKPEVSGT